MIGYEQDGDAILAGESVGLCRKTQRLGRGGCIFKSEHQLACQSGPVAPAQLTLVL